MTNLILNWAVPETIRRRKSSFHTEKGLCRKRFNSRHSPFSDVSDYRFTEILQTRRHLRLDRLCRLVRHRLSNSKAACHRK
jgi:hypothetical protein